MVGIVVVAHSAELAESVVSLARQMLRGDAPIAAAGGIDDPEHPYGTQPFKIKTAIESVLGNEGVVVLMDTGSSLLNAQMALEFLPEEKRALVRLCEAPLVEGAIAAAVQSGAGGSLEQVMKEAKAALAAKEEQLFGNKRLATIPNPQEALFSQKEKRLLEEENQTGFIDQSQLADARVIISSDLGIHARPAARLVTTASKFPCDISLQNLTKMGRAVNAKSIHSVTTLGALKGHEIRISAKGKGAMEAVNELKRLIQLEFTKTFFPVAAHTHESVKGKGLQGVLMSPGIAIGPVAHYRPQVKDIPEYRSTDPGGEWTRLMWAVDMVRKRLMAQRKWVQFEAGDDQASILDAHILYLEDPVLLGETKEHIFHGFLNAEAAWDRACEMMRGRYMEIEDAYLRSRSADLEDVKGQLLRCMAGGSSVQLHLSRPSILIARDLFPSDVLALDINGLIGVCTAFGSPVSHTAVLLRSLGTPSICATGMDIFNIPEGETVVLDADAEQLRINPQDKEIDRKREQRWRTRQRAQLEDAEKQALTMDHKKIEVDANISSVPEVRIARALGADGVGVLRTEFLFLARAKSPTEEEQVAAYTAIAREMKHRPLVIRTLDAGGDKTVSYLHTDEGLNPFLGMRGIRLCLQRMDLFRTQIRAVLRSSPGNRVKLMFPMVSTLDELRKAKEVVWEVQKELSLEGFPYDPSMEVGIMIEVPSVVALAEKFAQEVDFFSIGTNDLTQYMLAADRTNPLVVDLSDSLHPAVLRSVKMVVEAAHRSGVWVGVCGEIAGDICATPLLLGLGVDELSMNPHRIPEIKKAITRISMEKAGMLAEKAMNMDSARDVREYVQPLLPREDGSERHQKHRE